MKKPTVLNRVYELKRNWETPFTTFYAGHRNTGSTWAKLFGITEDEFLSHLLRGTFADWLEFSS
jgi:hypothetical protein